MTERNPRQDCMLALMNSKDLPIGNLGDCRVVQCADVTKAKEVSADHATRGSCLGDHVAVSSAFGNVYESGKKVQGRSDRVLSSPSASQMLEKVEVDDKVDFLILTSDGI